MKPEIITQMDEWKPLDSLRVEIKTTTHTPSGYKIIPTEEIRFSIIRNDGVVKAEFALNSSMSRSLAERIIEFCEWIDANQLQTDVAP